ILTGAVRARGRKMSARDFRKHREDLLAIGLSGHGWARAALEPGAPMLFFSLRGFTEDFLEAVSHEAEERPVYYRSLADLWPEAAGA
ncbi:MAG TPA: hypothetical protein VK966_01205, partial [Longimicrobiales bacterium]|nr:hypothetical protein [Longimicrobiales bacterium]